MELNLENPDCNPITQDEIEKYQTFINKATHYPIVAEPQIFKSVSKNKVHSRYHY